jgi:hypothetical protein
MSEIRSVRTRLTSSGIDQSPERSPASRWATGMPSLVAASAHASVELTSPATTTASGRRSSRISSKPARTFAVCSPWLPEPTPRKWSAGGKSRSARMSSDIRWS